jgi:hypothetical protein
MESLDGRVVADPSLRRALRPDFDLTTFISLLLVFCFLNPVDTKNWAQETRRRYQCTTSWAPSQHALQLERYQPPPSQT